PSFSPVEMCKDRLPTTPSSPYVDISTARARGTKESEGSHPCSWNGASTHHRWVECDGERREAFFYRKESSVGHGEKGRRVRMREKARGMKNEWPHSDSEDRRQCV